MACPNRNRKRPRTVAFRLTDEEFMRLDQRVKIAGEVKGDYLREMALNGEIKIAVGKYKSDKLALEIRALSEPLKGICEEMEENKLKKLLLESIYMIQEIHRTMY